MLIILCFAINQHDLTLQQISRMSYRDPMRLNVKRFSLKAAMNITNMIVTERK